MSGKTDQFADLFASSFTGKKNDSNLSMAERQKLKAASTDISNNKPNSQWGDIDFLSKSSSARQTPVTNSSTPSNRSADLFEGFDVINGNASQQRQTPLVQRATSSKSQDLFEGFDSSVPPLKQYTSQASNGSINLLDDFDILSSPAAPSPNPVPPVNNTASSSQDLDDLFAVFDKPAPIEQQQPPSIQNPVPVHSSQRPHVLSSTPSFGSPASSASTRPPSVSRPRQSTPQFNQDARDEAIAQLVDMGFSIEQSTDALNHTSTGLNVQEAISYIMNAAHDQARAKQGLPPQQPPRTGSDSLHSSRNDPSQYIQGFSSFLSTTTTKIVNSKYVNDVSRKLFSPHSAPNDGRPAWMRDQAKYKSQCENEYDQEPVEFDEAMLHTIKLSCDRDDRRETPPPQKPPRPATRDRFKLEKEEIQQSQSRHRRRAPVPTPTPPQLEPQPQPVQEEIDIFSSEPISSMASSSSRPSRPTPEVDLFASETDLFSTQSPSTTQSRSNNASSTTIRPTVPISQTQLAFFTDSRTQGGKCFKAGDFSTSLQHYETALSSLPEGHTLRIIAFSNCITTLLKNGQNKKALTYADAALSIIGPSKGVNEEIEAGKSMRDFWIKITTRKAEALEHLEKFQDALNVYVELIENGQTGRPIMEGKRRCQENLSPKPKPKPKPNPTSTPGSAPAPAQRKPQSGPGPTASSSSSYSSTSFTNETVDRVKASHAADAKLEEQKFQLHDVVTARLTQWSQNKEDNLRALLSTLNEVLPPELGWKTVSMADLVMPKKVKIFYMKAVGKTHPDKVRSDASVECKLITEGVFVVVNKAWEGFRKENGL